MKYFLTISHCPIHRSFWMVSLDNEDGGTRFTPNKCCGRWTTFKKWKMEPRDLKSMIAECECALENLESEPKTDSAGPLQPCEPFRNLKGCMCGLCEGTTEHEHPQSKCLLCGMKGLDENMRNHECKKPTGRQWK